MAKKEKNLFQKLTKLFKSGPVVRRKLRTLDTAVAVPDKTKSSGALLFQKSMAPTYATITANAYNLSERLMRYQDFCLTGDTLIATPTEEGCMRIDEICRLWDEGQRDHRVFSYDVEKNLVVSAKVTCAKQTGVYETVSVLLDDGSTVRCTSNHRFMLRDGSYVEAGSLKPGTSLMPFNRRAFSSHYRYVQTHARGWKPEHTLVAESTVGRLLCEGEHVHHKNFRHRDNRPENLEVMSAHDHMSLHAKINNMRFSDPAQRDHMSEVMKARWQTDGDLRKNVATNAEKSREGNRQRRVVFNKTFKPGRFNVGRKDQNRLDNGNADRSFVFQDVCDAYRPGMSIKELSGILGQSVYKICKRISWSGFSSFQDFQENYSNHKVVSVTPGTVEPVYDIEVGDLHNFALAKRDDTHGAQGIVFVHNSEMEYTPELAAALDIYADETCAQDEKGRVLHVYSDNEKIKEILEDLFYNTLNVEFNLRAWTRNLVKYGDMFLYNDVSPTHGVINAFPIPVNEIEREENYDPNDPMAVRYRWVTLGNRTLENWEVTHFRLLGNDMFLPYGSSVIEPARRIWRQLILIEDAMLVYRVVRAPERRVFYIDVANIPPENVPMYVEEQRKNLRSSQVIDRNTGRVDLRYNPLPVHKDTPVPLLDGTTLTIENLSKKMSEDPQWTPWVYSVQDGTKSVVPGKVVWCGKNYTANTLTKVWFDDGSYVLTAPEHPYVMSDGGKKRADEIVPGDSVMSAYRDLSNKGYERIVEPSGGRVSTHVMVARDVYADKWTSTKDPVVHHKHPEMGESNKRNNTPDNLEVMNFWEHRDMHARHCELTLNRPELLAERRVRRIEYNKSPEKCQRTSEQNRATGKARQMGERYNGSALHASHNEVRRQAQVDSWSKNRSQRTEAMQWIIPNEVVSFVFDRVKSDPKIGREEITSQIRKDESVMSCLSRANEGNSRDVSRFHVVAVAGKLHRMGCISSPHYGELKTYAVANPPPVNHQVVRVDTVTDAADDVYCMTVVGPRGEDDRHNFAVNGLGEQSDSKSLRSLIFVWNSVDEDYFIPVRGGESGTKIDTLAGGQNTAAVEDVAYIQKKLFAALKIPRAYLGYDEALSCVVPETPVDLLDGRTLTIEQVKGELDSGKDVWVYSVDRETLEMKPGRVVWAGPTRKDADLVRVTLDNGVSFTCTPDHKWMLRDGEWCQAQDLTSGTSLMPLHKRKSSLHGGSDYEQVFDPSTGMWKWTHQLVADRCEVETHESALIEQRRVVHHRDVNRFNNCPTNLVRMGFEAHRKLHADGLAETRKKALIEGKYSGLNNGWAKKCREGVDHLWSTQRLISWCVENRPTSKRQIVGGYGLSETQLDRLIFENGMSYRQFADRYVVGGYKLARRGIGGYENPNYEREKRGPGFLGAKFEVVECSVCHTHFQRNVKTKKKFCSPSCHLSFGSGRKAPDPIYVRDGLLNHTVVSVEFLTERRDTWCMEVAGTHTFGLSNGVIISNSKATLAQEDIRFSRTINVIQKTMVAELNKLAIIHLFANGFDAEDLQNFTLRLSNPSTVAQQQKLELWRAKFEIAGSAPEGQMSKEFIRKEIWGLNEDQCKAIDDQRLREKIVDQTIEAAKPEGEEEGDDEGSEVGGGEDLFGGGGEEEGGGEEAGDEEAGGGEDLFASDDVSEKEPGLSLVTAGDDRDDDDEIPVKFSIADVDVPVKAQRQLDRVLSRRARIDYGGASKTHMPDFAKMVKSDNKSMSDPYDKDWMNSYVRNPFGESIDRVQHRTPIGNDVASSLRRMSLSPKFQEAFRQRDNDVQVLSEAVETDDLSEADAKEFRDVLVIDDDGSK